MQFLVVISVLIYLSRAVNGECPMSYELHCEMYDTTNCPAGTKAGGTYIDYNGKDCDACQMCLPESAPDGCPEVQCPYESIDMWYPADCAIFDYPQIAWIDGKDCMACETFTMNCSNLSWLPGGEA